MSTTLESEIQQLFAESGDASLVAEQLIKRWDANVLSDDDIRTLSRFLIQADLYPLLLLQIRRCLKREAALPWSALAEVIVNLGIEPKASEIEAVFSGVREQGEIFQADYMSDLVESFALDRFDSRPTEFRKQKLAHLRRSHAAKKADLQQRLDYARAHRLMSQEKRLLDELQAFDPSDLMLSEEKNLFAFREAQEIVENALARSPPKSELERKFARLSPEMKEAAKPILAKVRELAKSSTETVLYDLALMLTFMELYEEAASVLERRRLSPRIDWLLLETLILGHQYAAALGEIESLEVKYAGDSEAPFALTYARARALWGLGDTLTAIELMKSLSRVRPMYRSAPTLLKQWSEEAR